MQAQDSVLVVCFGSAFDTLVEYDNALINKIKTKYPVNVLSYDCKTLLNQKTQYTDGNVTVERQKVDLVGTQGLKLLATIKKKAQQYKQTVYITCFSYANDLAQAHRSFMHKERDENGATYIDWSYNTTLQVVMDKNQKIHRTTKIMFNKTTNTMNKNDVNKAITKHKFHENGNKKEVEKIMNCIHFKTILNNLRKENRSFSALSTEQITSIFTDADNAGYYTNAPDCQQKLPLNNDDGKQDLKRQFSVAFQKECGKAKLNFSNTCKSGENKHGMRTKSALAFIGGDQGNLKKLVGSIFKV